MMTFAILGCTTVVATAQAPAQRPSTQAPSAQTPSTSAPSAEHKLTLTQQQKQTIMQGLASQQAEASTGGPQIQVGSKVPNTMMPHPMPNNVTTQVPETKNFAFVKLQDRF
jgi:hypothetical protein